MPNCLSYVLDGENDFIAMNDVTVHGFGPVSRGSTCTVEEFQLILTAMARFHGISFAFKNQHEAKFNKIAGELRETYFSEKFYESWYKRFHVSSFNIIKKLMFNCRF